MVLGMMRQEAWDDALKVLHDLMNLRMDDPWTFFLMGTCHRMKGNDGLAYHLLLRAMELKPDFYEAALNLCSILREMGRHDEEVALLEECRRMQPEAEAVLHNLAGAHLNNATPDIAERYAREAIEKLPEKPDHWIQFGLALLEQEKFGEGFDALDRGLLLGERKTRNFWPLGQTPMWDGTPGLNVVVYGEQGHGDEIMFASCLNEAIAVCNQVFIDTSKRDMAALYERSFPDAIVLCTPDSQVKPIHGEFRIDAAIPFGSLPTLYRREPADFPAHDGYIKAHPGKRRQMRTKLDELGDGLKIGVAWRGGVKKTHAVLRNTRLEEWAPILKQPSAHFISVQYGADAANEANYQQDRTGVPVHHWQGVVDDFDMLTALIGELDLVIAVPQSAVHQRAALGKECWVLTPHKAPWPFGLTRDDMLWYPKQARQFRRRAMEPDWGGAVYRCAQALSDLTGDAPGSIVAPPKPETIEIRAVG